METLIGPIEWGVATSALGGEPESGDRYVVAPFEDGVLVAAIDGLGHGNEAASAAQLAVSLLEKDPDESVITLIQRCHEKMRPTRGVVMSLASFNASDNTMTWLGVGNVEGRLVRRSRDTVRPSEFLLLRGGVVGDQLPLLSATLLPVQTGDTLLFATDGVALPSMVDLVPSERPQAVAEQLLSMGRKETDDALVLVARWVGLPR